MFQLNILKGNNKQNKEWTVTSTKKPSRRKKHYVHEADYAKFLRAKENNKYIKT